MHLVLAQLAVPADPTDLASLAQFLISAGQAGQWALLASVAVTALVAGLRKWVPESTSVGKWLRSKLGGVLTSLVLSLSGALSALLVTGAPFTWQLALQALSIALGASGTWSIWKNVREALDEKAAQKAGEKAAENPPSTLNQ